MRAIVDGAWGFTASADINKEEISRVVERAVSIAKASAKLKRKDVKLSKEEVKQDKYETSFKKDPFEVPLEEKLKVLLGKFMYGSKYVNIVADATVPGGLGTFGYDDEGTPVKKVYLVKEGLFVGYRGHEKWSFDDD